MQKNVSFSKIVHRWSIKLVAIFVLKKENIYIVNRLFNFKFVYNICKYKYNVCPIVVVPYRYHRTFSYCNSSKADTVS